MSMHFCKDSYWINDGDCISFFGSPYFVGRQSTWLRKYNKNNVFREKLYIENYKLKIIYWKLYIENYTMKNKRKLRFNKVINYLAFTTDTTNKELHFTSDSSWWKHGWELDYLNILCYFIYNTTFIYKNPTLCNLVYFLISFHIISTSNFLHLIPWFKKLKFN